MTQIPLPQPETQDIYSFFDKRLSIPTLVVEDITKKETEVGSGVNPVTSSGGIQIGKIQTSSQFTPLDIANDGLGTVRRVGAIKLASAGDLNVTTLGEAATANKVIYANNTNDLSINVPTTSAIVTLDTNGAQRVLVGIIKTGLTNSSANTIFQAALTAGTYTGGTIEWTVVANDGTDYQTRSGITNWAAVNKGGVYTTAVTEVTSTVAASAGTLTGTWGITTGTNLINLRFTPTSSLTPTTLSVFITLKNNNGVTITRV